MSHLDFAQHSVWLQNLVDRRQMEMVAHLENMENLHLAQG